MNVLLRKDGSAIVIDWPGLQVSDPRFDVAWALIVMTAIWGGEWRDRILREYEHRAGAKMEQIEFFEVGACMRFLFILIVSTIRGMHPNAEYMLQVGAFKRAYDLLQESTGIRWVEVERLLASRS